MGFIVATVCLILIAVCCMDENIGFTVPLFVLVLFAFRDTLLTCTGMGSVSELISSFHTLNAVQMRNITIIFVFVFTVLGISCLVYLLVMQDSRSKKD